MPQIAGPECYVEIFPFEGADVVIDGRQILSCQVHKNLREDAGTFEIILPPFPGPVPGDATSWTQAITPMSLTLIAMTRGDKREIVMIGVVLDIRESTRFDAEHGVMREIIISGQDLAYYFTIDNWAALTLMLPTAEAAISGLVSQADLRNNPATVAANWYNFVMDGDTGVNAKTIFPLSAANAGFGKFINFSDAMAQWFQDYPNIEILPFGDFYFASEGNWFGKFRRLLTYPVYEFFVMTAPSGLSQEGGADAGSAKVLTGSDLRDHIFPEAVGGFSFTMNNKFSGLQGVSSTPYVIGRVNVVPTVSADGDGGIGEVDFEPWRELPLRWPETGNVDNPGGSFIRSIANFGIDEAKNFYTFNGQALSQMFGQHNDNIIPLIGQIAAWFDAASIHRYGYKPFIFNTFWLYDGYSIIAQDTPIDVTTVVANIMARVFSYFHPTPLMLRAIVTYPLRPDIFPSMRFRYAPFKDQIPWEFYVDGVDHDFISGGPSTTTLTLSRGLPVSVYNDGSLMRSIIIGNAERVPDGYREGTPPSTGDPLKAIPLITDEMLDRLNEIAIFKQTPQGR